MGPHGLPERVFDLPRTSDAVATRSITEIDQAVQEFQPIIGRYPPAFRDAAHRESVYEAWAEVVSSAEALDPDGREEIRLFLLAELYRQGHNLDVRGAAERADSNISRCLSRFPRSRPCNLAASYFYLSVKPTTETLAKAERSLTTLRDQASPDVDEDAEAGFAFLYLYQRDPERARKQIEHYLELFPSSSRAQDFRSILENLGPSIELREW